MFNPNDMNTYLQRLRSGHGLRVLVIGFCVLTAALLFFGALLAHGEVDLADAPLFTKINPPPTNLMILLDDSGSMTFEILVRGAYDGEFPNPAYSSTQGFAYVFDDMGDGYNLSGDWRQMDDETRKYWRSQWHEINAVYYNPAVVYEPWPSYAGKTFPPADMKKPLVHPLKSKTLDLTKKAFTVDGLTVPWSHYFVKADNGTVYLVIIDVKGTPTSQYYIFTTDGGTAPNDKVETFTLVTPPGDIVRDPAEDLQNFVNWFSYHRRREFVAKAAIARVLKELDGVRVGILGINEQVIEPLKPVKAVISGEFKDETDGIIETLYGYKSGGGTPLKHGLEKVGEYYRKNNGNLEGKKGDAPYPADGGACQQSFTIVVTDGYYSDTDYNSVGNADGDNDNAEWGGNQVPFKDAYSDTLADIAMHYYATDLIPAMDDKVPTNKWDRADHQHMVTFAVAFGVSGTLEPDDYEDDRNSEDYLKYITKKEEPREYGAYVVWPDIPGDRRAESIDDLWHATVNGRGVFVNAGEPKKLVEGLLGIIKDIKARQPTSAASVTVNGDWLYGNIGPDVLIFQGSYSYINDEWAGEVSAYHLNQTTGEVITASPEWLASEKLQNKAWDDRDIFTFDGDHSGQVFVYDDLTADQKGMLGPDAENVVNFIRGEDPGGGNRANMLGDIVHSAVVFIDDVVYVGANDGMLHAINAKPKSVLTDPEPGEELFAYVPYLVFGHLKDLADPDYDHRFYVDLTPTVQKGENLLGESVDDTILVGGLGKGGMGYFALDITNPYAMSKNEVLWEFPNNNTAEEHVKDMGYSYSKPAVVRSRSAAYPWIVIAGNGYNSPDGKSVLFILDAITGTVIRKIQAGTGPDNGLSSPIAIDVNHDDVVDFVYAGDLKGNLWKFDLTGDAAAKWQVAFGNIGNPAPLFVARDAAGAPQPITSQPDVMLHPEKHGYIVCFGTGKFLGIGDYSDIQMQTIYGIWDYGDTVFQAPDVWSPDDDNEYLGAFVSRDRSVRQLSNTYLSEKVKLLQQVATDFEVDSGAGEITVRILSDKNPVWDTMADPQGGGQLPDPTNSNDNDAGWYLDLNVYPGERVIGDVILRDGILIAIGFIPEQSRCSSGGDSIFMELNAFTGGRIGAIQFDIHDDGVVGEDDLVEVVIDGKTVKVPPSGKKLSGHIQPPAIINLDEKREVKYMSSPGGGIVKITEKPAKTGIAYWMELRE
ncbi:MAG: PilC/PilY family type IV pilus protein [Desulfobacterales bacterium]